MIRRRLSAILGIALIAVAGCARKQNAEAPAAPSASPRPPAATSELSSGPASEPAESSLSIKRGVVTAEGDHAMFRSCDDKTALWLIDESEGALTELLTEGATAAYVEVYGERAPVPDDVPAARGQAGVFILEQLLYAGVSGETGGCEKPAPSYIVHARGNEPFWALQVNEDGMVWKQPEAPQEIKLGELQSQDAEGTVSYRASTGGHSAELLVDSQACRDSVSGEYFAFAARAVFDGKEFKGCAHVGK
jgi:uncharacterized membrane protein